MCVSTANGGHHHPILLPILTAEMVGHAIHSAGTAKGGSYRKNGRNIPLKTIKHGHTMDPQERLFLEAVEKGDKPTVVRCLAGESV